MITVLNVILSNLVYISVVIALIFLFQLGNLCFGFSLNVVLSNNPIDKGKLKKWLLKTLFTLLGTSLLCAGISILPFAVEFIGVKIPDEYSIIINFALIIITAFGTLKKEAEKCFENYKKCIENL